jgi:membrane protease YdiL (CAAX protease family)
MAMSLADSAPPLPGLSLTKRLASAGEVLLGAAIVIGHNVYRVLPNEVIVLLVLGLLSFRLRDGAWLPAGLRRPESWRRVILLAIGAVVLRNLLGELVILPLSERIWPPHGQMPAEADAITGHLGAAALALLLVWTFAAFGEEIVYRGYLLTRAAEGGGGSRAAFVAGLLLSAVLFGLGHYYKGPAGMIDSGVAGLIFGAAYLLAGRNLWACLLAHGLHDTFAVIWVYLGWEQ